MVQVLEHYGAALGLEVPFRDSVKESVMEDEPDGTDWSQDEIDKRCLVAAKKKTVAVAFFKRADQKRYGALWSELENNFTRGDDHYPDNLTGAYNLLLNFKPPPGQHHKGRREQAETEAEEVSALTFVQTEEPVAGTDGTTHATTKYYNCNNMGHYARSCPQQDGLQLLNVQEPDMTEETKDQSGEGKMLQTEHTSDSDYEDTNETYVSHFCFVSDQQLDKRYDIIPESWILLDSESTVSVFKTKDLVSNIRNSKNSLRVMTNGGPQLSSQIATVENLGDVWFNTRSLANILSMAAVRKVGRITMDTTIEPAMNIHRKDGTII